MDATDKAASEEKVRRLNPLVIILILLSSLYLRRFQDSQLRATAHREHPVGVCT
jgi:hypothetical protein